MTKKKLNELIANAAFRVVLDLNLVIGNVKFNESLGERKNLVDYLDAVNESFQALRLYAEMREKME